MMKKESVTKGNADEYLRHGVILLLIAFAQIQTVETEKNLMSSGKQFVISTCASRDDKDVMTKTHVKNSDKIISNNYVLKLAKNILGIFLLRKWGNLGHCLFW